MTRSKSGVVIRGITYLALETFSTIQGLFLLLTLGTDFIGYIPTQR